MDLRRTFRTPARQPNPGEFAQAPFPLFAPRRGGGPGEGAGGGRGGRREMDTTWSLIGSVSRRCLVALWLSPLCDPPAALLQPSVCSPGQPGALGTSPPGVDQPQPAPAKAKSAKGGAGGSPGDSDRERERKRERMPECRPLQAVGYFAGRGYACIPGYCPEPPRRAEGADSDESN